METILFFLTGAAVEWLCTGRILKEKNKTSNSVWAGVGEGVEFGSIRKNMRTDSPRPEKHWFYLLCFSSSGEGWLVLVPAACWPRSLHPHLPLHLSPHGQQIGISSFIWDTQRPRFSLDEHLPAICVLTSDYSLYLYGCSRWPFSKSIHRLIKMSLGALQDFKFPYSTRVVSDHCSGKWNYIIY